ncbi:MAG: lytic murein transglycosylase B [Granulosicoccaceae bacterium]
MATIIYRLITFALAVLVAMLQSAAAYAAPYGERKDVQQYIDQMVTEHGLPREQLQQVFKQIEPLQTVLDAISRPAEKTLTWAEYRPIFIKPKRIEQGKQFMQEHAETLARAEATHGVPASVITAIIGVETFYGRITGKYSVLEAVATLAFDYPPRGKFFKQELTEFLILSNSEGWDMTQIKGSYAGAMGWPQFISSSYRRYAVDFDGDGKRDLLTSIEDVIGSVANYLSVHGWKNGGLVSEPWAVSDKQATSASKLVTESLKPSVSPTALKKLGFNADTDKEVSVMQFAGKKGQETWIGYPNFYVITRYNHSRMYALAVHQLSLAVQ